MVATIPVIDVASFVAPLAAGLGGEVRLATPHGFVPLEAVRGEPLLVSTTAGFLPATVRCLGRHPAQRLTLTPLSTTRGGRHRPPGRARLRHELVVSTAHAFPGLDQPPQPASVGQLVRAATLPTMPWEYLEIAPELLPGFRHGVVFGDGTRAYTHTQTGTQTFSLRLCGHKHGYLPEFDAEPFTIAYPPSAHGEPVITVRATLDLKALPAPGSSLAYLRGFLAGWLAADSTPDGPAHVLATQDAAAAAWCVRHAPLAGYLALSDRVATSTTTNYGTRSRALHRVRLTRRPGGWLVERVTAVGALPLYAVELQLPTELAFDLVVGYAPPPTLLLAPGLGASALLRS